MKRYKLLKDLPYAKAGEVFERNTHKSKDGLSDYDYLEIKKRVKVGEDEVSFGIKYNYFLDNFDKWFEEIPNPTDSIHWKPECGEEYWIVNSYGLIVKRIWSDSNEDINMYKLGIVHPTEEKCEKAHDRELAKARLRRTSTFKSDFKNGNGGWTVYYDHGCEMLATCEIGCYDAGEIVRYKTRAEAGKSIRENREDWKIYFGVE